jgi:hypothetical protein
MLSQLFTHSRRLIGALADEEGFEKLDSRLDQGQAGHGAANANPTIVGDDFDDGVDVVLRLEFFSPATFNGGAGETRQSQIGDSHLALQYEITTEAQRAQRRQQDC